MFYKKYIYKKQDNVILENKVRYLRTIETVNRIFTKRSLSDKLKWVRIIL